MTNVAQITMPWSLVLPRAKEFRACVAAPWAYCCLVCNRTSLDDMAGHRCPAGVQSYPREYWLHRMRWAIAAATNRQPDDVPAEEVSAVVDKPIARTELARLLGESWLPSGGIR